MADINIADSNFQQNAPLRTHKRLGDIIDKYNTYISDLEKNNANFIPQKGSSPGAPSTFQPKYQYYHFQVSPQAIDRTDLGRILAQPFTDNIPSWRQTNVTNTTNSWLVSLGGIEQDLYQANQEYVSKNSSPASVNITPFIGVKQVLDPLQNAELVYNQNINNRSYLSTTTPSYIQLSAIFQTNLIQENIYACIASRQSFNGQATTTQPGSSYSITSAILSNTPSPFNCNSTESICIKDDNYVCYEITTFFKPSQSGYYTFNIGTGANTYVLLWYGDEAVAEFTYFNTMLNQQTPQKQIYVDATKYTFLRMQVYVYTPISSYFISKPLPTPSFSFDVTYMENNGTISTTQPTGSPFYSCISPDGQTPYVPTLLYAAFVTNSPDTYRLGEMQCYSQLTNDNVINYTELVKLYELLKVYKFSAAIGAYDNYGGSDQYGQLPNGVFYTPTYNGPFSKPFAYSVYRLRTDIRMGNTYQIDTQLNSDNQYEMKVLPKKFIEKDYDYTMYERYYPTQSQIKNATQPLQSGLQVDCQRLCNQNDNCNYFYSFALNKGNTQGQMCYIDQDNANPTFNQINPNISDVDNIQTGSSNLYIRNNQFSADVQQICKTTGKDESEYIQFENITQTNSYGSSFPYSNYYIDKGDPITEPESIGICAPKKQINQLNNCFRDVLTKPGPYTSSGIFEGKNTCAFMEGFDTNTIVTDAISNTQQQGISYIQQQENKFAHTMDAISQNYRALNAQMIPDYDTSNTKLYEVGLYDKQLENKLTFIGKQIPNAAQQNIDDNNSMYVYQNLMLILAMLTIAILLVLLVVM